MILKKINIETLEKELNELKQNELEELKAALRKKRRRITNCK